MSGKKIALLPGEGFHDPVFQFLTQSIIQAGADYDLLSQREMIVQSGTGHHLLSSNKAIHDAYVSDYDLLLLPGGYMEPLSQDPEVLEFIALFFDSEKVIAAFGDGISLLLHTGELKNRDLCAPAIYRAALEEAGARCYSQRKVISKGGLITGYRMESLRSFYSKIQETVKQKNIRERLLLARFEQMEQRFETLLRRFPIYNNAASVSPVYFFR